MLPAMMFSGRPRGGNGAKLDVISICSHFLAGSSPRGGGSPRGRGRGTPGNLFSPSFSENA
jgi:hypothetical protein